MFIVSVEIEIETAILLRQFLMNATSEWSNEVINELTTSIESGASEMEEVGMKVPSGVQLDG